MHTFSFQYTLCADGVNLGSPEDGYSIMLEGDAGKATQFELDVVMGSTLKAPPQLAKSAAPLELKFEVMGESDQLEVLRSKHYTLHLARNDGRPMEQLEVQIALVLYSMGRSQNPVFSIPRSTLETLLVADRSQSLALLAALDTAYPLQREVHIGDQVLAAGLVELGVILPTNVADTYALRDIEVR